MVATGREATTTPHLVPEVRPPAGDKVGCTRAKDGAQEQPLEGPLAGMDLGWGARTGNEHKS